MTVDARIRTFAELDASKMEDNELVAYCHTARMGLESALAEIERRERG